MNRDLRELKTATVAEIAAKICLAYPTKADSDCVAIALDLWNEAARQINEEARLKAPNNRWTRPAAYSK